MSHKKLILIADDEVAIHDSLRLYLQREGYEVYSVFRGTDVMEAFQRMRPDLVILDIMMPGRSGTEVCADIRAISMTPVIILTAKGEEADRLLGFALGADDYIVKPFSPREIVSRIRVIFRRINSLETAQEKNELQIGNTRINLSRYEVCVDGEKVVEQNNFRAVFTATRLSFWQDATEVAYVSNNRLYITNITVLGAIAVGQWSVEAAEGGLAFRWIGG